MNIILITLLSVAGAVIFALGIARVIEYIACMVEDDDEHEDYRDRW